MPCRKDLALTCVFLLMVLLAGCSNESSAPTPASIISVSVSPSTASVESGATQQFTAAVSHATNTSVTWQVAGVVGGNATVGTVSSDGLYTAPATVPSPAAVTVAAVSEADTTKSDSATVTVTAPSAITVTVDPSTAIVAVGGGQQFTATVANTSNTAVTWQVSGVEGGNATSGTISATGLYTAPAALPSPATVTVTAISVAAPASSDSATVTVAHAVLANRYAYVSSFTDNKIAIFSVDDTTGLIAASGTIAAFSGPAFLTMHPSGKFLYSLNRGSNDISIFSVDATNGSLSAAGTALAMASPAYMVFAPDGSFAYVTCDISSAVLAYSVNASTGALTPLTASPYSLSAGPLRGLAITPDGKNLYTADSAVSGDKSIYWFSADPTTGALTQMPGTTNDYNIGSLVVDKAGKFLYSGSLYYLEYGAIQSIGPSGQLSYVGVYDNVGIDPNNSVWTFDPSGTHLYGANDNVWGLTQNSDGTLTAIAGMPVSIAPLPNGGGFNPNGKFAYVVSTVSNSAITPGVITTFSVDPTSGAFTQVNSMSAGVNNTIGFAITP